MTLRLTPNQTDAVGVVLYVGPGGHGTVRLDDQAAVPAVLGEDAELDVEAIDHVTDTSHRSWRNALPWPGWRRRAHRFDDLPYH